MADGPGLLARIRDSFGAPGGIWAPRARAAAAAAPAGNGPVGPVGAGAIPPSYPWNWWQRALPTSTSGDSATVNACVNAYAQTIAQLQGGHFRETAAGEPLKIRTSALSRILRGPNPYQTRSDFMVNLVTDVMFQGNAYAWASRNARQEIEALHLMPARSTTAHVEPESGAIFYALGGNPMAGEIDYLVPQRDVLHVRGRCRPGEPLRGISPLTWALSAQAANIAISGTQAAFFNNASQPSGVLSAEAALTKEQMERLRAAWREHSAGVAAGEVPILGGGLKWVPMGITAQDAQLVEAFGMTVADIARAFGVPLPIVGDLSASTFNNTEQLIALWLSTGLGFWVEHIEIAFDKFFGLPADEYTELDTDTLLRTAFKDRIDGLTKAISGGLYSPNEARRKEGLGDVSFGDEPRLQAQVVPLSAVDKIQSAPSAPAAGPSAPGTPAPVEPAPANDPANDNATPEAVAAKVMDLAGPEIDRLVREAVAAMPDPPPPPDPPAPIQPLIEEAVLQLLPEMIVAAIPPAPDPAPVVQLDHVETRQDMRAREIVIAFHMSDGSRHETRARMMPGVLPIDHAALGWGVIKGDMIRDGDFDRTALVDNPAPGRPDHWSLREVRGRRGRDGKPGAPAPINPAAQGPVERADDPPAPIPPDDPAASLGEADAGPAASLGEADAGEGEQD